MLLLLPFVSSSLLLPAGRSVRLPESSKIARSSASRTRNSFPNGPARQVDANAGSATQVWLASPKVAARAGRVEALLEAGAPLEAANGSCFTPLDRAILMGNVELVKALREATNGSCSMPLEGAILVGNVELVKALLYVGASLEAEDASSPTLLKYAIRRGNVEVIQALQDSVSRGLITLKRGDAAAILDAVAPLKAEDMNSLTPLESAVGRGNVEMVETLIEALIEAEDANFITMIEISITPLRSAISSGNVEAVKSLLEAGMPLEAEDASFVPPLRSAVDHGNPEVVKALIDAGASLEVGPDYRMPILNSAIRSGNVEVVKTLIDAGASLGWQGVGDSTPLSHAMLGGKVNVIKVVLVASLRSLTAHPLKFAFLLILWLAALKDSFANGNGNGTVALIYFLIYFL